MKDFAVSQPPQMALLCAIFLGILLFGVHDATASCVSLSGSTFCDSYYGFHRFGVDSDTSAFFTALGAYFQGRTPRGQTEFNGPIINGAGDFDREILKLMSNTDTSQLFASCNVPKDKIQFLRPFICNWAILHSVDCVRREEPVICARAMDNMFQSVGRILENKSMCPITDVSYGNRRLTALRSAFSSDNVASRYFNGASNCIIADADAESYPLCGYGTCEAGKEMGCRRSCSGISWWAIVLIIVGALLTLLLIGLVIILCLMNRAKRRLGNENDAKTKWDGVSSDKRRTRFADLPKPIGANSNGSNGAPMVNVSIPDTPFNLSGGRGAVNGAMAGAAGAAGIMDSEQLRQYNEGRKFINKTVRAIGNFVPDLPDEMAVMEGDWLRILDVFEDNWASAELLRTDKNGRRAARENPEDNIVSSGLVPISAFAPSALSAGGNGNKNGKGNNSVGNVFQRTSSIDQYSRDSRYDNSTPISFAS